MSYIQEIQRVNYWYSTSLWIGKMNPKPIKVKTKIWIDFEEAKYGPNSQLSPFLFVISFVFVLTLNFVLT